MKEETDYLFNRMVTAVIKEASELPEVEGLPLLYIINKLRYAEIPDNVILDKLVELENGGVFYVDISVTH